MVWLNSTGRRWWYVFGHEYTLLEFLLAGIAELGEKDRDLEVTRSVLLAVLTPSDIGPL